MPFIEAPSNFYMGRTYDPQDQRLGEDIVYYDSRDLLTHAVVVGMTGSGKTGLCISMLEEAILDNVPAIIIDPKGDIANLALTFPQLRGQDFAPWIHDDDARRANMDKAAYAEQVAAKWREGLANWGIAPERLAWLQKATELNIYTPGSDSGLQISILASLRAPRVAWQGNEEIILERISGTVTALFALGGLNYQPVKDVEHVLLTNILEWNWRQGRDLTLEDIIMQIKQPPFEKLGVFPLEQYMNERKRYKLAMEMNNVIAAPSFQTWLQGEPLDIQNLLYRPDGKPRVSIFYIAHLNDQERMFIMTLLLENIISWMRMQRGTPSLRAILYVDELYGYFPPHPFNPPTKGPFMRLLKQARAFGIGLVLATQNPGDLDYKGLTNAGTWFIGRLQSKNDRDRVMAGLRSLETVNDEGELGSVEQLLADIKPRVFIMRNVHQRGSVLLHSRWCMNYLAGPLTRVQIAELMAARKQERQQQLTQTGNWLQGRTNFAPPPPPPPFPGTTQVPSFQAQSAPMPAMPPETAPQIQRLPGGFLQSQPPVPAAIQQYFLPATLTMQQAIAAFSQRSGQLITPSGQVLLAYVPLLLAQLEVRYQNKTSGVYTSRQYAYHVTDLQPQGLLQWQNYQAPVIDARYVTTAPAGQAIFQEISVALLDAKRLATLQKDLIDMIANTARLEVGYHPLLKIYSDPDQDYSVFQATVMQMIRERRDAEYQKLAEEYRQKLDKLESQIADISDLAQDAREEVRARQRENLFTTGESIFSLFRGYTYNTVSRMSRTSRQTTQARGDAERYDKRLERARQDYARLHQEAEAAVQALNQKWLQALEQVQVTSIAPLKKDIHVVLYGIGWLPHYYVPTPSSIVVVPSMGY